MQHRYRNDSTRFRKACICQPSKDQTWDWQLSIEGDAAELDNIQSVTYQLPNVKKKTTRDRKSGFKIEGNNSGIITAVVDVNLSDKRTLRFEETFQLSAGRESEGEEKHNEITEIAKITNQLFTPSPAKIVDLNAPAVSTGLEPENAEKPEEITDFTDRPIIPSSPESSCN